MSRHGPAWLAAVLILGTAPARGEGPAKPAPNRADEPLAGRFSAEKGAAFLDAVAVDWTRARKCGTCHTNYAHMIARPSVKGGESSGMAEVRAFFEGRVAGWDRAKPIGDAEVVATASALALNDAATTGKLHPTTRAALDRMWTLQRPDGAWKWFDCDYPPSEDDDYYGAAFAALGVGHAPEDYKSTDAARRGLDRLRAYFRANPAPNLHHRALLLWASTGVDGLMDAPERERTIKALLDAQRPDGGWSLASLGPWTRRDGSPVSAEAPSDGYGTGFAVFVLRRAGVRAEDGAIRRGVAWLRANQRASGRWFTRSLTLNHSHYITHAGTGFALMALGACEAP